MDKIDELDNPRRQTFNAPIAHGSLTSLIQVAWERCNVNNTQRTNNDCHPVSSQRIVNRNSKGLNVVKKEAFNKKRRRIEKYAAALKNTPPH